MRGPATSHPAPIARPFPRPRGGTARSAVQSIAFAALFVTGLDLWLTGQQRLMLWAHVLIGLALLVMLAPWLARHIPTGLGHSQRSGFTILSWALLVCWLALLGSGLFMALPAGLWLAGVVWFPQRAVTETLSLVHFWSAWLAMGGLFLHLTLRHWGRPWG
ncbi:hypothetical protein [Paracoccus sp. S1E-3]|uniref:hypothetical protein n=1 Tax=Paracoccus sp. S1E-3 TaxID=2756130 RepID=UPI0015EFAD29|nr:hypothetical protein [Paracoccus sp. S1E-3]MBA4492052.1 hypothetical protein [Paracoccus sp. S1E-3]